MGILKQSLLIFCLMFMALMAAQKSHAFTFSSKVPKAHKKTLIKDIERMKLLQFEHSESERDVLSLLGIEELNAVELEHWLQKRVSIIIDEKAFSPRKIFKQENILVHKENVTYPNADIIPYSLNNPEEETAQEDEGLSPLVVMTNAGASIYLEGKKKKQLLKFKLPNGLFSTETIVVNSPRVGILQIGEGLFNRRFNINNNEPDSISNSIHRLGVLFHEARHSDGHAESLAYVHALCPRGHDLEGFYACDENSNGPYTVSAQVVSEMLKACGDLCTEREREILLLTVLDSQSRVLQNTFTGEAVENWNAKPEMVK